MLAHQHESLLDSLLVSLLLAVHKYIHFFLLWNVEEFFRRSPDRSTMPDLGLSHTHDARPRGVICRRALDPVRGESAHESAKRETHGDDELAVVGCCCGWWWCE